MTDKVRKYLFKKRDKKIIAEMTNLRTNNWWWRSTFSQKS